MSKIQLNSEEFCEKYKLENISFFKEIFFKCLCFRHGKLFMESILSKDPFTAARRFYKNSNMRGEFHVFVFYTLNNEDTFDVFLVDGDSSSIICEYVY